MYDAIFGLLSPHSGHQSILLKSGLAVTRYHGQLSSCTLSAKTNDPIFRKLSDGRTDARTDRKTDKRSRVISYNAVRLTSSVQQKCKKPQKFEIFFDCFECSL